MKFLSKANGATSKSVVLLICILSILSKSYSQANSQMGYTDYDINGIKPFKISSGDNVVKIGTIVSSYLDFRQYPAGDPQSNIDYTKNTIKPKDARLDIKGRIGDDYEYHLQLDFAEWGSTYAPDGGPLDDANFTYKGLRKLFNINVGYGKVPFSLNSLVEHYELPYWERPQISKGDFMSRRDMGIRLDRSWWDGRIRAEGGVYTGVGEVVLGGTNDPSGAFEYIGRVEASFPENHNEEIVDVKGLTTPNISIGVNDRYSKRDLPGGDTSTSAQFLPSETGELLNSSASNLDFKVVNGEKNIFGFDVSVEWQHFSAQFESDMLKATPQNPNDPLLMGKATNYFRAGGWYAQGNYFIAPAKMIVSYRYDELNANDLLPGDATHWAAGLCYQLKGYNSMIKAEFDQNLQFQNAAAWKYGGEAINTSKWHNEYRIGWQLVID